MVRKMHCHFVPLRLLLFQIINIFFRLLLCIVHLYMCAWLRRNMPPQSAWTNFLFRVFAHFVCRLIALHEPHMAYAFSYKILLSSDRLKEAKPTYIFHYPFSLFNHQTHNNNNYACTVHLNSVIKFIKKTSY